FPREARFGTAAVPATVAGFFLAAIPKTLFRDNPRVAVLRTRTPRPATNTKPRQRPKGLIQRGADVGSFAGLRGIVNCRGCMTKVSHNATASAPPCFKPRQLNSPEMVAHTLVESRSGLHELTRWTPRVH